MKKTLGNLIIVVVLLVVVGVGSVRGAVVYTTGTDHTASGTIAGYARQGNNDACNYTAYDGSSNLFTLDGEYSENLDVWAIVLSEIDGTTYFNGYGYSFDDGTNSGFLFEMFGDYQGSAVPASQIIFILNDGNSELFMIEGTKLIVGLGNDIVLGQEAVSINGGAFGDISEIAYLPSGDGSLDSVELVTPAIMIDSPENGSTGINPNSSLVWEGDVGSTFEVHLYDDKGGPVYVFPDLTDTSLDVNGYLDWNTTYNWQVDEVIGGEVTYSSPVWTFTTIDYECQSVLVGDLNSDCVINLADFAMMANSWLSEVPKIPKGSGG